MVAPPTVAQLITNSTLKLLPLLLVNLIKLTYLATKEVYRMMGGMPFSNMFLMNTIFS